MNVAFLGMGKMGRAITRHLLAGGDEVTVWNRTPAHAEEMASAGARVARTAAEAAAGRDVVFTMVMNDDALEQVMEEGGVFASLGTGAIHVAMSTLSVAYSKKLTEEHARRGQGYVAAPVFGRPHVAEAGKLWTAVGGAPEAVARVRPLLERFSRGITVVSDQPWSAHAMKLGGNFLITAMIASLTEGFLYAEAMGIDAAVYGETVNQALFQSPFYELYTNLILHPPAVPGGTIEVGEKDMRLFREAAHAAEVKTPVADVLEAHLQRAMAAGMQEHDWAGGYYELARMGERTADS